MNNPELLEHLTDEEFSELTSVQSEAEWNAACDRVKKARDGAYPRDWWPRMMLSGVMHQVLSRFEK